MSPEPVPGWREPRSPAAGWATRAVNMPRELPREKVFSELSAPRLCSEPESNREAQVANGVGVTHAIREAALFVKRDTVVLHQVDLGVIAEPVTKPVAKVENRIDVPAGGRELGSVRVAFEIGVLRDTSACLDHLMKTRTATRVKNR